MSSPAAEAASSSAERLVARELSTVIDPPPGQATVVRLPLAGPMPPGWAAAAAWAAACASAACRAAASACSVWRATTTSRCASSRRIASSRAAIAPCSASSWAASAGSILASASASDSLRSSRSCTSSTKAACCDRVAVVTLDAPARRNALTLDLVDQIAVTLDAIESDPDVGAIVVTGASPAFCAGADLSHLGASKRQGLRRIYEGFLRIGRSPLPTIAAVNGAAVGAGVNLALVCDVIVAGESARFDTRFLQLGLHPGGGHTWMLRRRVGPQAAAAMILFGRILGGREAHRAGLVWSCVPDDELLPLAHEMAGAAAAAPRDLVVRVKQTLADVADITVHESAVDRELDDQVWSIDQPAFQEKLAALQRTISSKS